MKKDTDKNERDRRLSCLIDELPRLKVRRHGQARQWCAGFWDEGMSPSCASGDVGFYGTTPEDAVRALFDWIFFGD